MQLGVSFALIIIIVIIIIIIILTIIVRKTSFLEKRI